MFALMVQKQLLGKTMAALAESRWKQQTVLAVIILLIAKTLTGEKKKPVSFNTVFDEEVEIINFITSSLGNTSF